ncbi:MAG: hypothetical protein ACOYOT_04530 [Bacteroidales bacterium]
MSKRKQLIFFTWFQLFVLLFPMAIKEVHIHVGESHLEHTATHEFVLQPYAQDHCEICDFEFVPFIPAQSVSVPVEPLYSSAIVSETTRFCVVDEASNTRLRAPPVCL